MVLPRRPWSTLMRTSRASSQVLDGSAVTGSTCAVGVFDMWVDVGVAHMAAGRTSVALKKPWFVAGFAVSGRSSRVSITASHGRALLAPDPPCSRCQALPLSQLPLQQSEGTLSAASFFCLPCEVARQRLYLRLASGGRTSIHTGCGIHRPARDIAMVL
jgi:hypothetical protein